jgi:hypothetical protein
VWIVGRAHFGSVSDDRGDVVAFLESPIASGQSGSSLRRSAQRTSGYPTQHSKSCPKPELEITARVPEESPCVRAAHILALIQPLQRGLDEVAKVPEAARR